MVFSIFSEISQYPYSTLVQALATLGRHCLSHPHKCMEALLFAVYCSVGGGIKVEFEVSS